MKTNRDVFHDPRQDAFRRMRGGKLRLDTELGELTAVRQVFRRVGDSGPTEADVYEVVLPPGCRLTMSHSTGSIPIWAHAARLARAAVIINLGFSFVADHARKRPINSQYHLQVAGGELWSLPTKTRTALVLAADGLSCASVEARGWLAFGDCRLT
jgi:hypothetical protein